MEANQYFFIPVKLSICPSTISSIFDFTYKGQGSTNKRLRIALLDDSDGQTA